MFWGLYRDVQKRAARGVRALGRQGAWDDILAGPMLDTRSTGGLLVLDGPSPLLGGAPNFHMFARLRAFERADLDRAAHEDAIFAGLLTTPRGILELLSRNHSRWLIPVKRHRAFIEAVVTFWPVLTGEGQRYTLGSGDPKALWELPTNIQFVLARSGASIDEMAHMLPVHGPAAFLPLVGAAGRRLN